jgi:hypothetical protein
MILNRIEVMMREQLGDSTATSSIKMLDNTEVRSIVLE